MAPAPVFARPLVSSWSPTAQRSKPARGKLLPRQRQQARQGSSSWFGFNDSQIGAFTLIESTLAPEGNICNTVSRPTANHALSASSPSKSALLQIHWSTMTQAAARTDKILVVDDDARIRDLLRRYLTQEGFEVILAEDGKALNRLMLRETADLIVLDLMMHGRGRPARRARGRRRRLPRQAVQPTRTAGARARRAAPPARPGGPWRTIERQRSSYFWSVCLRSWRPNAAQEWGGIAPDTR